MAKIFHLLLSVGVCATMVMEEQVTKKNFFM